MAKEGKRRLPRVLLWSSLIAVVVLLGAAAAYFFLGEMFGLQTGNTLIDQQVTGLRSLVDAQISGFTESDEGPPPLPGEEPPGFTGRERSYRIQEGETLWSIAKKSGIVDSPWAWGTIIAQNRDKFEYALLTVSTGEWKVIMEPGQEITVREMPPAPPPTTVVKKYAIQMLTLPRSQRARAVRIVKQLLTDHIYAFTYLSKESGTPVYRVRAGFYDSEEEAKRRALSIRERYAGRNMFPDDFWITISSDRELRGELLDFGAQRIRPWVIELPARGTQGEALEDLRQVVGLGDFDYIAQQKGHGRARFNYRARFGYFTSRGAARNALNERKPELPLLEEARVVPMRTFAEALPGQRFKVSAASY